MKAKILFCNNEDDLEKYNDLGVDVEPDLYTKDWYFKLSEVSHFLRNDDGNISLSIYGERLIIEWDENIWNKLVKEFEDE